MPRLSVLVPSCDNVICCSHKGTKSFVRVNFNAERSDSRRGGGIRLRGPHLSRALREGAQPCYLRRADP